MHASAIAVRCSLALAARLAACPRPRSRSRSPSPAARSIPVSGPVIENGTVVITDGQITAVGANVAAAGRRPRHRRQGQVGDARPDQRARPRSASSRSAPCRRTNDARGEGRGAASPPRSACGRDSTRRRCCGRRRATRASRPSSRVPTGGLIAGQAAFVDTAGATRAELLRRRRWRWSPASTAATAEATSRGELLLRLRELLDDARDLCDAEGGVRARRDAAVRRVARCISRRCSRCSPASCRCSWRSIAPSDIQTLLDLAREYKLRVVDPRRRRGVEGRAARSPRRRSPVLTAALDNIPTSFDDARRAAGERRAAAQGRRPGRSSPPSGVKRSTCATSGSTPATPSPTGCRGTRRCAR